MFNFKQHVQMLRKALFLSIFVSMFAKGISVLSRRWSVKAGGMLVVLAQRYRARRACEVMRSHSVSGQGKMDGCSSSNRTQLIPPPVSETLFIIPRADPYDKFPSVASFFWKTLINIRATTIAKSLSLLLRNIIK